jgi:hypothetical protein
MIIVDTDTVDILNIDKAMEYDLSINHANVKTAYRNRMKEAHHGNIYHNMMMIRKHMETRHANLLPWFDGMNVVS